MTAASTAEPDAFQPGQLGIRHLLGVMSVACVILGISAARLRTMQPLQKVVVGWNWLVLLSIVAATFYFTSRRQRRNRLAAGDLLLRTYSRPTSERSRAITKWVLTAMVIVDGILLSVGLYPSMSIPKAHAAWSRTDLILLLLNFLPMAVLSHGMLWGWCLSHWLTNIYIVELRENGLLTHHGFVPWAEMKQLGWSTVHPSKLAFYRGGHCGDIYIDPGSRDAVDAILNKVRAGTDAT